MHTRAYTRIHAHTRAHTHTNIHTHKQLNTQAHTQSHKGQKLWSSGRVLGSQSEGHGFNPRPMQDESGVKAVLG